MLKFVKYFINFLKVYIIAFLCIINVSIILNHHNALDNSGLYICITWCILRFSSTIFPSQILSLWDIQCFLWDLLFEKLSLVLLEQGSVICQCRLRCVLHCTSTCRLRFQVVPWSWIWVHMQSAYEWSLFHLQQRCSTYAQAILHLDKNPDHNGYTLTSS